ncbi:MAG: hypothetical protein Ct9H300mP9_5890 [Candidatus Neomarinimicrobiota bacterium]|nr:MAG: hypothetical protein Ct9H300mP9_5890 [Candidatus Neomarinimicrobiota bacterium]
MAVCQMGIQVHQIKMVQSVDDDASEWEKRLEGQEAGDSESGNENPDEKEEVPKKKGLFGRKKK